jgi:hypothetical protein
MERTNNLDGREQKSRRRGTRTYTKGKKSQDEEEQQPRWWGTTA